MTLGNLHAKTLQWGEERNFYNPEHGTTTEKQFLKLSEEVGEIASNLARGKCIKDDIGDCLVVLTGLAKLSGTSLQECWEVAWEDIKDRKGVMKNGVFIKSQDLESEIKILGNN